MQRAWQAYRMFSAPGDAVEERPSETSIRGRAIFEKDSVALIESEKPAINAAELTIRAVDDMESLGKLWTAEKERWGDPLRSFGTDLNDDDERRLLQYLRNCYADFDLRPPSLSVVFAAADWELGLKDSWFIDCVVPRRVFDALTADIVERGCSALKVGVQLNPALSDQWYAPPSVAVTFGILKDRPPGKGAVARGWIEQLQWQTSPKHITLPEPIAGEVVREIGSKAPPPSVSAAEYTVDQLASVTGLAVAELARKTTRGFVLVLVLIVLVAVLR